MSDNDKCHFAGTTAEWHYGKQRLKRRILRLLRKTASDGADVTWCCKPFQTRAAATGKARLPMIDSCVWRTISNGDESVTVRGLAEFIGKVRRCCTVLTLVNKDSKLEIDSLRCHQPGSSSGAFNDDCICWFYSYCISFFFVLLFYFYAVFYFSVGFLANKRIHYSVNKSKQN